MGDNKVVLEFAGESKGAEKAAKDTGSALDQLVAAVKQVADSVEKNAGQAEKALGEIGQGSEIAFKEIEKSGDKIDKETRSWGDKLGTGLKAGAAAAGLAAGALLVDQFGKQLERGNMQAKLTAMVGDGGSGANWSKELGASAGKLYAQAYGDSIGEVGDALYRVTQSGAVMEDESIESIENITKKVMSLSSAFDQDLSHVISQVGQLIKNGLAKDADSAMDLITRGFQQGLDKSGDFLDTIEEYSVQFASLGLSGDEAFGLISQALRAGARDSDVAADALKEFSLLVADTARSGPAFKALGLDGKKMADDIAAGGDRAKTGLDKTLDALRKIEDPAKRNALAVELFGTKAEDMKDSLLAMDVTTAAESLGDVAGAAEDVDKAMGSSAQSKIDSMKRGFDQWVDSLVNTKGAIGDVTAVLAGFGGDIMGAAGSFGIFLVAMKQLGVVTGIVTAATWAYNTALKANPIILIISLIIGLVTAFVILWNKSAAFRDFFIGIWEGIKGVVSGVVDFFKDIWGGVVDVWDAVWKGVSDFFTAVWDDVKATVQGFVDFFSGVWDGITDVVGAVVDGVMTAFEAMWEVVRPIVEGIGAVFQVIFDVISFIVQTLTTLVVGAFVLIMEAGRILFEGIVSMAMSAWNDFLKPLFEVIGAVASAVWEGISAAFKWAMDGITAALQWVADLFRDKWNATVDVFRAVWEAVTGWISDKWNATAGVVKAIWDTISGAFSAVGSGIKSAWDGVTGWIRDKWNSTVGLVKSAWDAVAGPIKSAVSAVGTAFENVGNAIKNAFRSAFNFVASAWNNTVGRINFTVPDWIPGIGGAHFGIPKIPTFHTGGVVPGNQGQEVLAWLRAGERVVPEGQARNGGGGSVNFRGNVDQALATLIMRMVRDGQIEIGG